jgi:mannose-6-phosphate isomerase-like protein (cupin superfamily)
MKYKALDCNEKPGLFDERWSLRAPAEMNDYQSKRVEPEGDFVWHDHPDADETCIVLDGELRIAFEDGRVDLKAGETYVVPRGTAHRPRADSEARVLLIEPLGTVNIGEAGGEPTVSGDQWI